MDVRLTKDKQLVVFNGQSVRQILGESGDIGDWLYQDLEKLDAARFFSLDRRTFPERNKGIRVPLLRQVLQEFWNVQSLRISNFYVDLKDSDEFIADALWDQLQLFPQTFIRENLVVGARFVQHYNSLFW